MLTLVALSKLAERTDGPATASELQSRIDGLGAQLGIIAFPDVPVGGYDVIGAAAD